MLFWVTIILVYGYVGLELFLLLTRRGKAVEKRLDRGTLQIELILIGGSCFAAFFLARRIEALNWPQKAIIVYLADILLVSGIALRIWAIHHLGRFFTVDVGIQAGHHIIQDGPYRFVRHPSYSGAILALIGIACLTFNWLGFFLIVICTLTAFAVRIPVEERALREQFDGEYEEYAARTKRLIPRVY
ncbi:MAG: isoprenylcysteine carboxylmethyltransferase family protein [Verrucomicrobia bacterium]|nr:isoprenylcysteine carboxylmethyltransferase family protein [Verrucomicrobiota bacterium]